MSRGEGGRGFRPEQTSLASLSSLFQDLFSCNLWVYIAQSQVGEQTASKLPSLSGGTGGLPNSFPEWQMLRLLAQHMGQWYPCFQRLVGLSSLTTLSLHDGPLGGGVVKGSLAWAALESDQRGFGFCLGLFLRLCDPWASHYSLSLFS